MIIRTKCSRCGQVDTTPDKMRLLRKDRLEYTFVCPTCGDFVVLPADANIVALLLGAGVQWGDDPPPLPKYPEVIEDPEAPPLTADDLIDFHFGLEAL